MWSNHPVTPGPGKGDEQPAFASVRRSTSTFIIIIIIVTSNNNGGRTEHFNTIG